MTPISGAKQNTTHSNLNLSFFVIIFSPRHMRLVELFIRAVWIGFPSNPMVHYPIFVGLWGRKPWSNHSWTCCKSTGLPSNTSCTFPWKIWKSPSIEVSFSPWIPAMFQGDDWDDSDLCWVPDPKPLASGIPRPRVPLVCSLGKISKISRTSEGNTAILVFLIGGLEHLDDFFHSVGNFMIPTDFHSIIFQRGGEEPPTSSMFVDFLSWVSDRKERPDFRVKQATYPLHFCWYITHLCYKPQAIVTLNLQSFKISQLRVNFGELVGGLWLGFPQFSTGKLLGSNIKWTGLYWHCSAVSHEFGVPQHCGVRRLMWRYIFGGLGGNDVYMIWHDYTWKQYETIDNQFWICVVVTCFNVLALWTLLFQDLHFSFV